MHRLREGDRLRIGEPRNLFALQAQARRSLLIAGGIGITPLLAMADHLAAAGAAFTLHYCARTRDRAAFTQRIEEGRLKAHTRFHFDDEEPARKLDLEAALHGPDSGSHLYVCGPAGFMDWVLAGARARGWPEAQLHREYFAAPAAARNPADAAFELLLRRSGRSIRVAGDQRVIDALAAHGIAVPVSCEQGVCGTCLTRVVDGTPEHRDLFLTDEEHARNDCFTPCCSRSRTARLVLDL